MYTVDQKSVCDEAAHTQDLNTEETDFIGDVTSRTHRCKDNPTSTHTHTSHYCLPAREGCCQGSAWANWLVASAHHCRNSPVGLAGSVKAAFQDVFPSPPIPTAGSLITLIICTHCSSNLISSALQCCFFPFYCFYCSRQGSVRWIKGGNHFRVQIYPHYHMNDDSSKKWS